jgi:hypothetical protein
MVAAPLLFDAVHPRKARADTVFFHHTAETLPLENGSAGDPSPYYWSNGQVQSGVTQSSSFAKSGTYSLRHEVVLPAGSPPQTGKVLKFYSDVPGAAITELYFSQWFYFPSSGNRYTTDSTGGNWQIWTNHSEFKPTGGTVEAPIGTKIGFSFNWFEGVFSPMVSIYSPKYNASATSLSDTMFTANYFAGAYTHPLDAEVPRTNVWVFDDFTMGFGEWAHVEIHLVKTQQNGRMRIFFGKESQGTISQLCDFQDSNLDILTMFNDSLDQWTNNSFLYWAGGNYISELHANGTYLIHTDDWRVADYRVGPTLSEFALGRTQATARGAGSGRVQASGRTQASGRVQVP